MYRKIITALAALTVTVSMTACGAKSNSPAASSGATAQSATTQTQTTAPTETAAPQFDAISLVENDICTVTVTGLEPEGMFGYGVNLFLENKTDMDLMYTVDNVSVNGYMCDPFWAATVAAGKKANEQMTFLQSDLDANGIDVITDITFTLKVYDSSDWIAEYLVEQSFTVNP